jgi:hypothetical protein
LAGEKRLQPAVDAWKKALALADEAPPELVSSSSAPEVAKAMAELCRKNGLGPQAQSLEEQSIQLEERSGQFVEESLSSQISLAELEESQSVSVVNGGSTTGEVR